MDISCVRMYDSLCIISCTLYFIRMTLYAYVLYISVRRQASHHICISYAKHDDDRLMSLKRVYPSLQKNLDYNYPTSHNIIEQTKKETWIIRKSWFTRWTVLCSTTHSSMRMMSYVRHDVDWFEFMVRNQIESWRRNHLWNTALVPDASHFAHDFGCRRHGTR